MMQSKMAMTIATVLVNIVTITCCAAQAGEKWRFPGQGNEADWRQAMALSDKAESLFDRRRYKEALKLMKTAIRIYPYQAEMYQNLAVVYENGLRDIPKAEKALQRAITMNPEDFGFRVALVGLYCDWRKVREAKLALPAAEHTARTPEDKLQVAKAREKIARLERNHDKATANANSK